MNKRAFSLAELMIVLLIMTIILAATMPILSKRAKVKAAAAAGSGSNSRTCLKIVTSSIVDVNLGNGVIFYQMIGGGGGGAFIQSAGGGGGGSSAILIDNVLQAYVAGGAGGYSLSPTNIGQPGAFSTGAIFLDPSKIDGHKISAYAGGGGGAGGGCYTVYGHWVGIGGRSGAGYCGGNQGVSNTDTYSTVALGGSNVCSSTYQLKGSSGNTSDGSAAVVSGSSLMAGGGGGFGGNGGDRGTGGGLCQVSTNTPATDGSAATSAPGSGAGGSYTTGGKGGYVMLYYITTSSSCPAW